MMRKRHPAGKLIAIVLQTLIAVVVASQMCTAVSKSQDNGILLTGRSSLYGLTNCRLMAQGISIIGGGGIIWNRNRPTNFYSINQENKTFFEHNMHNGRMSAPVESVLVKKADLIEQTTLCGQKCSHYAGYAQPPNGRLSKCMEFWTVEHTSLPANIVRQWCAFYSLPPDYGFPIQVQAPARVNWPHTFQCLSYKPAKIAASDFDAPPGYRRVKDRGALFFSQDGSDLKKSDIEEIFSHPLK